MKRCVAENEVFDGSDKVVLLIEDEIVRGGKVLEQLPSMVEKFEDLFDLTHLFYCVDFY